MKNLADKEEFTEKGRSIYKKLQNKIKENKGKIVTIEIDSGDYFISEDEAWKQSRKPEASFLIKYLYFSVLDTLPFIRLEVTVYYNVG